MRVISALIVLLAVGCGDDDGPIDGGADAAELDASSDTGREPDAGNDAGSDAGEDAGADVGADVGTDAGPECPRVLGEPDGVRRVVVSHPFAGTTESYEMLELDAAGVLSRTDTFFSLGEPRGGEIAFTPDGEIGLVVQDDGSLGVFRVTETGVEVVHAAYSGDFYAAGVIASPDGTGAWVRDAQWRASGGGIYWVEIGCDGRIISDRQLAASKLPYGFLPRQDGSAVVFAKDILDTVEGADDVFLVDLDGSSVLATGDVFPNADWIGGGSALTADEQYALIGDNGLFSEHSVGIVRLGESTITAPRRFVVEDPVAIVTSPMADAAIVVSGFGDAIFRLTHDPDADPAWANAGELTYVGTRPQLPGAAVQIRRGSLDGLVLVSENLGIRSVRFAGAGNVEDLGAFSFGMGVENVVGAIGVQP